MFKKKRAVKSGQEEVKTSKKGREGRKSERRRGEREIKVPGVRRKGGKET